MPKFTSKPFVDEPNVAIYTTEQHPDDRGYFEELYNSDFFGKPIRQISHSVSKQYTFRGFHLQFRPKMEKIMYVRAGAATIFFFDTFPGSPQFLRVHKIFLTGESRKFVHIPWYFAVGFIAQLDDTEMLYFQTAPVNPQNAVNISYRSCDGMDAHFQFYRDSGWHISEKDENAPTIQNWLNSSQGKRFLTAF